MTHASELREHSIHDISVRALNRTGDHPHIEMYTTHLVKWHDVVDQAMRFSDPCHPCHLAGIEGMECSLPMDGRRVSLTQLSKDSFRECQVTLTLTDLLIIIFSGISVSVVAIMTSFFLASTVHCFQRWSKGTKGDEEESEE